MVAVFFVFLMIQQVICENCVMTQTGDKDYVLDGEDCSRELYSIDKGNIRSIEFKRTKTLPENGLYKSSISRVNFIDCTITILPSKLFYACYYLQEIIIPSTVVNIDVQCFSSCTRLINVTILNTI